MGWDPFNRRALGVLRGELAQVGQLADGLRSEIRAQSTQYEKRVTELVAHVGTQRRMISYQRALNRRLAALKAHAGEESSMTYSWTRTPMSVDDAIKQHLRKVRARSRHEARADEVMTRFLNLTDRGVVGPEGMTLQAGVLNQNGELDEEANNSIEEAFLRWAEDASYCDIEGRLSWVDLQSLFIRTVARDGEFLARKIRGADAGPFGFSLQVLDPELLDVDYDRDLSDGNRIRFGIEFNHWWRPVAYHLRTSLASLPGFSVGEYNLGQGTGGTRGERSVRIPAADIIHSFIMVEPGQRRGWPWAFSALLTMKMLGGYEEAALVAARTGASKFFVLERAQEQDRQFQGDAVKTSEGEGDRDGEQYIDAVEPGTGWMPPPGSKISSFDPTYPHGEFDPFARAIWRRISSGCDVSYMSLSGDLSQTSYASGRQGLQDERDVWIRLHGFVMRQLCRPVYREWLALSLLNEQITIRGKVLGWTPEREQKFLRVFFHGRTWPWIDPEADVAAAVTSIEQNLTTRTEVARQRTRRDFVDICKEREQENKQLVKYGIAVPVVGAIPGGRVKEGANA